MNQIKKNRIHQKLACDSRNFIPGRFFSNRGGGGRSLELNFEITIKFAILRINVHFKNQCCFVFFCSSGSRGWVCMILILKINLQLPNSKVLCYMLYTREARIHQGEIKCDRPRNYIIKKEQKKPRSAIFRISGRKCAWTFLLCRDGRGDNLKLLPPLTILWRPISSNFIVSNHSCD